MHPIKKDSILDAWQCCIRHLCSYSSLEEFNLLVVIKNPTNIENSWLDKYNTRNPDNIVPSTRNVVNTIFPYKYIDCDEKTTYERYMKAHQWKKERGRNNKWGTYFERIISFPPAKFSERPINQLGRIILSINQYNINLKAAYVIHTSSPSLDSIKIMGNPCLQYLEFLCPDKNTISLLAVYRNHDYFNKALGNFIGLGYLLNFVCNHTNRAPGELICHSAHAYIESKKKALQIIE